jgi:transposase
MRAYSLDLRTKIVDSVRRRGVSKSETARSFGINRSTVGRYLKRLDEGGSRAPKKAPGSPSKLDESPTGACNTVDAGSLAQSDALPGVPYLSPESS